MANRWIAQTGGNRGSSYDEQWAKLAATGESVHGEADAVCRLVPPGSRVLDAGCGTGRVAIALAHRGYDVVGVDADASMLEAARAKAPELDWRLGDLAALEPPEEPYDLVVMAGNVMIFVAPGTEGDVLRRLAASLTPDGLVVAGFQLLGETPAGVAAGQLTLEDYDRYAAEAGLELVDRWATWEGSAYGGGDYAVSIHRRVASDHDR